MTTSAATGAGLDRLDARLLALDPDLEDLFAEVEQILYAAASPTTGPEPGTGTRSRWSDRARPGPPALRRGRRPGPERGIGRGPPHPDAPAPTAAVTAM